MAQHVVGRGQVTVTELIDGYTIIVSPDSITVPASPTGVVSAADLAAIPVISVKVFKGDVELTPISNTNPGVGHFFASLNAGAGGNASQDQATGTFTITELDDATSTAWLEIFISIEKPAPYYYKTVTITKAYQGDTGPIAQYWGAWSATTQYYNDPHVQYMVTYNGHWYATIIKDPRTPIPKGTVPTNTTYWQAADESKFIATNLLLADDAYIGQLNSPKVYIGDNGTNGWVIDSGSISSIAKNGSTPLTQLTSDGKLIAQSADIKGAINATSLTVSSGDATTILNQAGGATTTQINTVQSNLDNLQIGGTNLLLQSNAVYTNSDYMMHTYIMSGQMIAGQKYTISVYGTLGADRISFMAYLDGGSIGLAGSTNWTYDSIKGCYYITFTGKTSATYNPNRINVYQALNTGTSTSTITKIKLEIGNKATDWSPAPEDITSSISNINSALTDYIDGIKQTLQDQIDGEVDAWSGTAVPTLSNTPASDWNSNTIKDQHVGDTYFNVNSGVAYIFDKTGTTYSWKVIGSSAITKALADAAAAQATADGKMRILYGTAYPNGPYDVGDMFMMQTGSGTSATYVIYKCITKNTGTTSNSAHWTQFSNWVTGKDISDAVDGIQIGGTNIFSISELNTNATTTYKIITNLTGGTFKSQAWASTILRNDWVNENLKAGVTYTFSFTAKLTQKSQTSTVSTQAILKFALYASGTSLTYINDGLSVAEYNAASVGDTWQQTLTFTCPTITTQTVILYTASTVGSNIYDEFEFSEVQLEQGTKATSYSPSPEDVQAMINSGDLLGLQQAVLDQYTALTQNSNACASKLTLYTNITNVTNGTISLEIYNLVLNLYNTITASGSPYPNYVNDVQTCMSSGYNFIFDDYFRIQTEYGDALTQLNSLYSAINQADALYAQWKVEVERQNKLHWERLKISTPDTYNNDPDYSGFGTNYDSSATADNHIILTDDPFGKINPVWETTCRVATVSIGGGFTCLDIPPNLIDSSKIYRVSVYVRSFNAGVRTYFGAVGAYIDKDDTGVGYGNQYFGYKTASTSTGRWQLWTGYIMPKGTLNADCLTGSIYWCDTGEEFPYITSYKGDWADNVTPNFNDHIGIRVMQYNTAVGDRTQWYAPRFEQMNGQEPTIDDLLNKDLYAIQSTNNLIGYLMQDLNGGVLSATEIQAIKDAADTGVGRIKTDLLDATAVRAKIIAAGKITTTELDFIPVQSTNVIASINASAEGGGTLKILGKHIQIDGTVTFGSGYSPTEIKNASASTADSKITAFHNTLGDLADLNVVEFSKLGTTVIQGQYIKTGLVNASYINTGTLSANLIAAGSITADKLDVGDLISNSTVTNYVSSTATTAANTAADAIQIGGTNLLPDSHFYSGQNTNNIGQSSYGTSEIDVNGRYKFTVTTANAACRTEFSYKLPVGDFVITIQSQASVPIVAQGWTGVSYYESKTIPFNANFQTTSFKFTVTTAGTVLFRFYIGTAAVGQTFFLNWIKIEAGNKPTAWSPAPEDATTYTDNSINDIQVGGVNLLLGATTPASFNTAAHSVTYNADNSFTLKAITTGSSGPVFTLSKLSYAGTFTLSFEYRTTNWNQFHTPYWVYKTGESNHAFSPDGWPVTCEMDGEWHRVVSTFSNAAGIDYTSFMIFYEGETAGDSVDIRNVKLEEGTKATTWSLAPEDNYNSNIVVGGTNLLGNSRFYTGTTTGWNVSKTAGTVGAVSVDTTSSYPPYTGIPTLRIEKTSSDSGYCGVFMPAGADQAYWGTLVAGQVITVSFWIYFSTTTSQPTNSADVTIGFEGNTGYIRPVDELPTGWTTGQWYKISKTLTIGTSASSTFHIYAYALVRLWVADLKIEYGNKATDWSPAPQDLITYTNSQISNVNGQISLNASAITTLGGGTAFALPQKTISTGGWYRFAAGAVRSTAKFILRDLTSSKHATAIFYVNYLFSKTTFQLVAYDVYGNGANVPFTKIRVVQWNAVGSSNPAYIEVYCPSTATLLLSCLENFQSTPWTAVQWTAGEIPTSYSAIEFPIDADHLSPTSADVAGTYATQASLTVQKDRIDANVNSISSQGTRLTTAEGNITINANNITSAVSRITTAEGKISTNTSAISQNADDITLEVTARKDLASSVGNLVNNPAASGNINGWGINSSSAGTASYVSSSGVAPFDSIGVLSMLGVSSFAVVSNTFKIDPSKAYQVEVWVKLGDTYHRGTHASNPTYYFGLSARNAANSTYTEVDRIDQSGVVTASGSSSASNNVYFQYAGLNTLSVNRWDHFTAYILPAGFDETKAVGLGNCLYNARVSPDADNIYIRLYNYYNETDTNTVFYTQIKCVEVDSNSLAQISDAQASIKINSDSIALKVDKDDVVTAINLLPGTVQIDAKNINLNGAVTISSFDSASSNILTGKYIDTRDDNQPPSWYRSIFNSGNSTWPAGTAIIKEFKRATSIADGASIISHLNGYVNLITEVGWSSVSGGVITQTINNGDTIYKRYSSTTDATWTTWLPALNSGQAAADINSGTTTINGGKITTGTITANQIQTGSITIGLLDSSTSGKINNAATATSVSNLSDTVTANLTIANRYAFVKSYSSGKMIYRDPTFLVGTNNMTAYGSGPTRLRVTASADCPTASPYMQQFTATGTSSPALGGYVLIINSRANAVFVERLVMQVPTGYTINLANNAMGDGASKYFITSTGSSSTMPGTGNFEEYLILWTCGSTGTFSSGGHFYFSGPTPTTSNPLVVNIAYASVFDMTDAEVDYKKLADAAQSTADGIRDDLGDMAYLDLVSAAKLDSTVITGGYIKTSLLDVGYIKTQTITAANINALALSASSITTGTLASARIAANTITVAQLNFTPVQAGGAAADINAHTTTITGSKITTNSIDANRIITSTLTALGAVTAGSFNIGSGKFAVTSAGVLTASSGTIGGWVLNDSWLTNTADMVGISAASAWAIWAGGSYANRDTANFRVNTTGSLYCSDVHITGEIYASSGSFTGTVTATSGSFTGTVTTSALTVTGGSITGTSITLGSNFSVTSAGTLTALAGSIGGWNINSSGLYNDTVKAGLIGGTGTVIYAGQTYANRAAAPFTVDNTGSMTATKGKIGGFTITDSQLSSFDTSTNIGLILDTNYLGSHNSRLAFYSGKLGNSPDLTIDGSGAYYQTGQGSGLGAITIQGAFIDANRDILNLSGAGVVANGSGVNWSAFGGGSQASIVGFLRRKYSSTGAISAGVVGIDQSPSGGNGESYGGYFNSGKIGALHVGVYVQPNTSTPSWTIPDNCTLVIDRCTSQNYGASLPSNPSVGKMIMFKPRNTTRALIANSGAYIRNFDGNDVTSMSVAKGDGLTVIWSGDYWEAFTSYY